MGPASDMRFVNFLYTRDRFVFRAPWTDFNFQTRVEKLCFCIFSSWFFSGWNLSQIFEIPRKISEKYRCTKNVQSHARTTPRNHLEPSPTFLKAFLFNLIESWFCGTIPRKISQIPRGYSNMLILCNSLFQDWLFELADFAELPLLQINISWNC